MSESNSTAAIAAANFPAAGRISLPRVFGWANFLAMSWTWCIGMYLPVLILRDIGIGGFWAFALPNIFGTAAMGWVLKTRGQSEAIVREHRGACAAFSVVTILFHAFFAAWLIRQIAGPAVGLQFAALYCVFWVILQMRGGAMIAALAALLVSLLAMGWGFATHDLPFIARPISDQLANNQSVLYLAVSSVFGFLLCPYLDLTFHSARQSMGATESKLAFTFGFAVIFTLMILCTACYSGWLVADFDRVRFPMLSLILTAHLTTQSCFTTAAHAYQLNNGKQRIAIGRKIGFAVLLLLAVGLGLIDRGPQDTYHGVAKSEVIYCCFLGFYALAFPAYVWLRIVPPKRSVALLLGVIVICTPLFWMAYIERHLVWILPGVAIALLAKFLPARQAAG